jgi:hypothetical protein
MLSCTGGIERKNPTQQSLKLLPVVRSYYSGAMRRCVMTSGGCEAAVKDTEKTLLLQCVHLNLFTMLLPGTGPSVRSAHDELYSSSRSGHY